MAIYDIGYKVFIFKIFKEYVPRCPLVGFVKNVFRPKMVQGLRCLFGRENADIILNKFDDIVLVDYRIFEITKIVFSKKCKRKLI